jgi:hypothetical protein
MNYRRGLNRIFWALSVIWALFVLAVCPLVAWNAKLNRILIDKQEAEKYASDAAAKRSLGLQKMWERQVTVHNEEYSGVSRFSDFYKQLLEKDGVRLLLSLFDLSAPERITGSIMLPLLALMVVFPESVSGSGWLVMLLIVFLPLALLYIIGWAALVTLEWIILGFRSRSST